MEALSLLILLFTLLIFIGTLRKPKYLDGDDTDEK